MASNPISQSDSSGGSSSGSARFSVSVDVSNFTIHVYSPIIGLEFGGLHSSIDKVARNKLPTVSTTLLGKCIDDITDNVYLKNFHPSKELKPASISLRKRDISGAILIEFAEIPAEFAHNTDLWTGIKTAVSGWLGINAEGSEVIFGIPDEMDKPAKRKSSERAALELKVATLEDTIERLITDMELLQASLLK